MNTGRGREDMNRTSAIVVGLFTDQDEASDAIDDLREAGFRDDDIGVAMRDRTETVRTELEDKSSPAEGAAKGALSGGLVGGALGLLGSLLIPGVGPIVAGGVLATTLTGAGIGAATGGLIGALVGMGVSKEEAEHFDRGFREGGILITVRAGERAMEARAILRDANADLGPSWEGRELEETVSPDTSRSMTGGADLGRGGNRWYDSEEADAWQGQERRIRQDVAYAGPERRVATF